MMTENKNGFTLLELLIAATLVAVLAMFATQAFRASASDIRVADAKARALLLLNAAERYYVEYPGAPRLNNVAVPIFSKPNRTSADAACNTQSPTPQDLVDCGFLEYRQIAVDSNSSASVDMWFEYDYGNKKQKVCFKGKEGGRVIDHKCTYCTAGDDFTRTCSED